MDTILNTILSTCTESGIVVFLIIAGLIVALLINDWLLDNDTKNQRGE